MKNKIKAYRAVNDLTQERLAQALRVTHQTILAIEKDKHPSLELAFHMAKYFNTTIEIYLHIWCMRTFSSEK
jgi:putative transcriptional regulator